MLEGARSLLEVEEKTDVADVFTRFDVEVQAEIERALLKEFPNFGFLGEEGDQSKDMSGEYCWVVDPIDGTENFTHQLPGYGTSIALLRNGTPILGVVNFPEFRNTYTAIRGKGASKNGKRIHVRSCTSIQRAVFGEFFSDRTHRGTKVFYPPCAAYRRFGSAVMSLMYLAEGAMDAVLLRCRLWDVAASAVIIEEAGGTVALQQDDANNARSPLYFLATSPGIFQEVRELVKKEYYPEMR